MMRRYGFLVMAAVLLLAGAEKDAGSAEQTKPASGETFTLKIGNTVSDIDHLMLRTGV